MYFLRLFQEIFPLPSYLFATWQGERDWENYTASQYGFLLDSSWPALGKVTGIWDTRFGLESLRPMFHQFLLDLTAATVYWMQPQFKAQRGQACAPTHPHIPERQIFEIMVPGHMALLWTFLWLQKRFCCCVSNSRCPSQLRASGHSCYSPGEVQSFVVGCHCPTIIWGTRGCQEVIYAEAGMWETRVHCQLLGPDQICSSHLSLVCSFCPLDMAEMVVIFLKKTFQSSCFQTKCPHSVNVLLLTMPACGGGKLR